MTALTSRKVTIPTRGQARLEGDLALSPGDPAVVAFAHGSGSSRLSRRNQYVAGELRGRGVGTLLTDLLSQEEEREDLRTHALRFDIALLADRVVDIVDWLRTEPATEGLRLGLFGASTGAAAALIAAARRPDHVAAVVSRGGRPDLASVVLPQVRVPTLLIVGERDSQVLDLNRKALERLAGPTTVEVVAGASHLFEEPGTLEEVARLAGDWFQVHLAEAGPGGQGPKESL